MMPGTQYGGVAAGSAIPATAMQNAINAKESTLLEQHYHELNKLNEVLGAAVQRTTVLADRLIGPEPQPPQAGSNGAKPDPSPMFSRVEGAARLASTLAEIVHQQLNRLERL